MVMKQLMNYQQNYEMQEMKGEAALRYFKVLS